MRCLAASCQTPARQQNWLHLCIRHLARAPRLLTALTVSGWLTHTLICRAAEELSRLNERLGRLAHENLALSRENTHLRSVKENLESEAARLGERCVVAEQVRVRISSSAQDNSASWPTASCLQPPCGTGTTCKKQRGHLCLTAAEWAADLTGCSLASTVRRAWVWADAVVPCRTGTRALMRSRVRTCVLRELATFLSRSATVCR